MKYMLDKIRLLKNKDNIINTANDIVKLLKEHKGLNDSEKIMTIELAVAQLNYDLYHISGDGVKK